jgi:hypothetical protein
VPRSKEFCPFENDFFDIGEFDVVGGVRVHRRHGQPDHRATDGVLVRIEGGKVTPVNSGGLSALSERLVEE